MAKRKRSTHKESNSLANSLQHLEKALTHHANRNCNEDPLALATKVYEGLSESEIAEIEKIALDRSNFFGERT